MEVEVVPGMLYLIWLVTTESDFAREEGTCLIAYHNAALDNGGRRDKYTQAEGEVGSPILGIFIGLKFKVVDGTVATEIVLRWGQNIVGNGVFFFVKILAPADTTRDGLTCTRAHTIDWLVTGWMGRMDCMGHWWDGGGTDRR